MMVQRRALLPHSVIDPESALLLTTVLTWLLLITRTKAWYLFRHQRIYNSIAINLNAQPLLGREPVVYYTEQRHAANVEFVQL